MPRRIKTELLPEFAKCPVCQREQKSNEFEVHHVVARVHGGSNDPVNLLSICCTCHSIITRGCREDMTLRDSACFYHQLGRYGLDFVLKSGLSKGNPVYKYVATQEEFDSERLSDQLQEAGWMKYFELIGQIERQAYFIPLPQTVKWGPPERLAPSVLY